MNHVKRTLLVLMLCLCLCAATLVSVKADASVVLGDDDYEEGKNVFGLCYIENSQPGDYTPARKHIYMGGITVLVCGEESHTSVYNHRGGTELASFDGPQIVMIMLMLGHHQQTATEGTYWGHAIGVIVFDR